jgi:hypothetical protein
MSNLKLIEHMSAFYRLARLRPLIPFFNCFPLRRTWVLYRAAIGSKIRYQNTLGPPWTAGTDNIEFWYEVVDIYSAVLRL